MEAVLEDDLPPLCAKGAARLGHAAPLHRHAGGGYPSWCLLRPSVVPRSPDPLSARNPMARLRGRAVMGGEKGDLAGSMVAAGPAAAPRLVVGFPWAAQVIPTTRRGLVGSGKATAGAMLEEDHRSPMFGALHLQLSVRRRGGALDLRRRVTLALCLGLAPVPLLGVVACRPARRTAGRPSGWGTPTRRGTIGLEARWAEGGGRGGRSASTAARPSAVAAADRLDPWRDGAAGVPTVVRLVETDNVQRHGAARAGVLPRLGAPATPTARAAAQMTAAGGEWHWGAL